MTTLATWSERRTLLIEQWRSYYANPVGVRDFAASLFKLGYLPSEIDRAREAALEGHLYGGPLPSCEVGISPDFMRLQFAQKRRKEVR